jgi:GT2 family glycosyltransferase
MSILSPAGFRVIKIETVPPQTTLPIRVTHPDPAFRVTIALAKPAKPGWYQLMVRFPPDGTVDVLAQICFAGGEEVWQRLLAIGRNHFAVHVRCSGSPHEIKLTIRGSGRLLGAVDFSFTQSGRRARLSAFISRLRHVIKRDGIAVVSTIVLGSFRLASPGTFVLKQQPAATRQERPYETWIRIFDENPERDRPRHLERLQTLSSRPLFSVITVSLEGDELLLDRLVGALLDQLYPEWELIVAVSDGVVGAVAEGLSKKLPNRAAVSVVGRHANPALTLNTLVSKTAGEFLILLPVEATLRPNALLELALTLQTYPAAELIYADEDQIKADGTRQYPVFKPAWSPDVFDVCDYLGHVTALRRSTVLAAGGWRLGDAQVLDYDLRMRVVDRIEPDKIIHLAKILAHISAKGSSVAMLQSKRGAIDQIIREHCGRRNKDAEVNWSAHATVPRLKYRIDDQNALVSLIIPTRDRAELLQTCVRSILARTTYRPFEILIVDNGSQEAATQQLFSELLAERSIPIQILHYPGTFNFSALNNAAARHATGSILGLLNNDLEVENGEWLSEMVALACRPDIACVGCKLLYPDRRIQHAGVYLGLGGIAGHGHRFAARESAGYMNRLHTVQNVSAVTAACLLIRKNVFDQVGGLDEEDLKVNLNDVDLCLRARSAGYLNLWTPFAELIHHESASRGRDYSPAKARRLSDEANVLAKRWASILFDDPYYSPHLTSDGEDFSVRVR